MTERYETKIVDVKRIDSWWSLHLEDGRSAGLPLIVKKPEPGETIVIFYRVTQQEGAAQESIDQYGTRIYVGAPEQRYIQSIVFRGVPIDCAMFDELVKERDRLRAANIALRQAAGYDDDGRGVYTKPPRAISSLRRRLRAALRALVDD